jgi:hypothetical protein
VKEESVLAATPGKNTAAKLPVKKGRTAKSVPTPSTSDDTEEYDDDEEHDDLSMPDLSDGSEVTPPPKKAGSSWNAPEQREGQAENWLCRR